MVANSSEKSFWVGKWSLKTWRTRAKENLERGVYTAIKLSLLEDVHLPKNGTRLEEAPLPNNNNNVLNDHDANTDDKENLSADLISETIPLWQNGGSGDNVPNCISKLKSCSFWCSAGYTFSSSLFLFLFAPLCRGYERVP